MSVMTEGEILRRVSGKRGPILVAGEYVGEVRSQGRMLRANGYVPTSGVLRSEVTRDYYQWWHYKEEREVNGETKDDASERSSNSLTVEETSQERRKENESRQKLK